MSQRAAIARRNNQLASPPVASAGSLLAAQRREKQGFFQPLQSGYGAVRMIQRLNKLFDHFWIHMYHLVEELRGSGKARRLEERQRKTLAETAKRAIDLWKLKNRLAGGAQTQTMGGIESELRKLSERLSHVEFLDPANLTSLINKAIELSTTKTATRYQDMVLAALDLNERSGGNGNGVKVVPRSSTPGLGRVFLSPQSVIKHCVSSIGLPTRLGTASTGCTSALRSPRRLAASPSPASRRSSMGPLREEEAIDLTVKPLFGWDVLTPSEPVYEMTQLYRY